MKIADLVKFYADQDWSDLKKHIALMCVRYGAAATAHNIVADFISLEEPNAIKVAMSKEYNSVEDA